MMGCALLIALSMGVLSSRAADSLNWGKEKDSVDADIQSWSLLRTLESISEATGWQVYLEPGTKKTVSTRFKERPKDRALDLLLGNLGRVLLPGTNGGPARLLVFKTDRRDATRLIRSRGKNSKAIANELIVRMKKGRKVDDLAKELGAKVVGKSDGLNSGRLQFENEEAAEKAREALLENDDVESVDPNYPVLDQPSMAASGASGASNLKLQPVKEGEAIIIALIDTAVHPQGTGTDGFLLDGISVANEPGELSGDQPTHGDGMGDAIAEGLEKVTGCEGGTRARVMPVDVYGRNKTTTTYEVAEGIYQAMQRGASIINLSLGSEGDTPYLQDIINKGIASGRVFVASAGNTPVTTPTYPAAYSGVIAVTAGQSPGKIASYANRGDFVDVMAPGGTTVNFRGQNWRFEGTSSSAAIVSGMIAGGADCGGSSLAAAAASVQRLFPVPR